LADGERRPDRTSNELSPAFARTDKKRDFSSSSLSSSSKGKANVSPRSRRPKKMSNPFDNEDLSFRCLSFPFKSLAVLSEKGRTLFSRVSASLGARFFFFFSGRGLALFFLRESAAESFGFLFVRGVNQ